MSNSSINPIKGNKTASSFFDKINEDFNGIEQHRKAAKYHEASARHHEESAKRHHQAARAFEIQHQLKSGEYTVTVHGHQNLG